MRVLYVIDDGVHRSGQEVTLKNWVPTFAALREHGIDLDVVSLRSHVLDDPVHVLGGEHASLASAARVPIHRLIRLRNRIDAAQYSLVHANEVVPCFLSGLARLGRKTPRLVFHRHHERSAGAHGMLSKTAARLADVTFAESQAVARAAHDLDHVARERVRLVPHGTQPLRVVAESELSRVRRDLSIPADALVVTVVARLRPEKGLDVLIAAADRAAPRLHRELHLIFVGDGPEATRLGRQLHERHEFVAHMVGHDPDVARWFALADVVAVPSLSEPFGLVVIEAMAGRRPVVASNVGGPADIVVHGKTGLLVRPGDSADLGDGIVSLLEEPAAARRMGDAGYERYRQRYTLDAMITEWVVAYKELLDRK